jgi:MoaA/NifB/PqqE/SkfB family radical SAM enzyme
LSTEKALEVIKIIHGAGIKRLDITGGEPFLRKDIIDIMEQAKSLGLEVVITSNGSTIDDGLAEQLANLNVLVQISLDGPEDINSKLRGNKSFRDATQAIEILKKHSVRVRMNATIQNDNLEYVDWLVEFAKKMKVDGLYFILISAQGRSSRGRDRFCLDTTKETILRSKIQNLREQNADMVAIKMLDFKQYSKACLLIDTNGDFISQCWAEEDCVNAGNIFDTDILELWKDTTVFNHVIHLLQYLRHPILYK